MNTLIPLARSHTDNLVEHELRKLLITLFKQQLGGRADDINCYGMPHLGSQTLLKKYLVSQGVSNFNASSLSEDYARYLVLAWRYRNPKRGTQFLNTFLQMVWGTEFDIFTLWQHKNKPYTQELKTEPEILEDEESLDDYFQTSRLRITLYGESGYFSMEIAKSLNYVLPARLFVQEVSRTISGVNSVYFAHQGSVMGLSMGTVYDEIDAVEIQQMLGLIHQSSIQSVNIGTVSDE